LKESRAATPYDVKFTVEGNSDSVAIFLGEAFVAGQAAINESNMREWMKSGVSYLALSDEAKERIRAELLAGQYKQAAETESIQTRLESEDRLELGGFGTLKITRLQPRKKKTCQSTIS
jgi:nucleoid DNA-binding protein